MRNHISSTIPDSVWQKPLHFIAFGFGSGAMPFAPGTFGTLIAIPFYLAIQSVSLHVYLSLLVCITLGSIWLCHHVAKEINVHDHPGIVLDEIVGYLITMTNAPSGITWIILGFILFRFFDIWKPWPIRYIDAHVSGGIGIVLDDVLAGVYSFLILQIVVYLS
ncbi:MAG: Phosphatidylglycerophosphatase A [uncultured bacterium]|nr:MAG: Phosphatidylglycerophosphatase A [uncultured bacterium]